MSVYQTEEEQVEAIKKWWKENGFSVAAGVSIGLAGVFGWQAWQSHQDRVGQEASVAFSQMIGALDRDNRDSASKQAELLRLEYEGSAYADFAALLQARLKLESGDAAAARSQLEWVMNNSGDETLRTLARLRLARVQLDSGSLDEAAGLADVDQGGFAGAFAALRGDIAAARKDTAAARRAYERALELKVGNSPLIRMKLDELADAAL